MQTNTATDDGHDKYEQLWRTTARSLRLERKTMMHEPVKLNLGCGKNILDGWVNIDSQDLPGVDLVVDLDEASDTHLPYDDDSVDEFLLSHVLEHLHHPLWLMAELHRIAKPNALITIRVPYGSSNDAFEDPTHVRQYFIGSFTYFSQAAYCRADYGYRGDWESERVTLTLEEARYGHEKRAVILPQIQGFRNVVREMVCEMRAIKPARMPGETKQASPIILLLLVDDKGQPVREVL